MQIRPQLWTHHHTHRLYHLSLGFCFAFAALAMVGTMTTVWMNAGAEDVLITATVGGVTSGPTQTSGSGGSAPQPNLRVNPTISIVAEPQGEIPVRNSEYVFSTPRPTFSGTTSVPNGLVFITMHGQTDLNSTTQATLQGKWYWQAPVDLPIGSYTIRAAVFDSYDLTRSGSAQVSFIIESPEEPSTPGNTNQPGAPGTPPTPSTPTPSTPTPPEEPSVPTTPVPQDLLFGVFFNILNNYKYVTVGDKIIGSLTVVSNSDKPISGQDINYKVISPSGAIILDTTDTISFSKKTQLLKTFFTAPLTSPGDYSVKVSGVYQGVTSVASDTFRLILPVSTATTELTKPNGPVVIWTLMVLLWLLFIILVIIAYRRVRHHTRELQVLSQQS